MPITIAQLIDEIQPETTVLLFGSGSSIPSGAPSATAVIEHLSKSFNIAPGGFTLREITSIIEQTTSRRRLISELRSLFNKLTPTGGLANLSIYDWKSLYTTNYDSLIEQTYAARSKDLIVYTSNFDFTVHGDPIATKLFKLHGTIDKDISDGSQSRIVLTESDYDYTDEYREFIYDRFRSDLAGSQLVIIGQSLADQDIKEVVNRAASINMKAHAGGQITLLLYTPDEQRAPLFEKRGLKVCFGGIDDFFGALAAKKPNRAPTSPGLTPLDDFPALRPITLDVAHESDSRKADVSAMFNGWPADYATIVAGATFERTVVDHVGHYLLDEASICSVILGASGVGKTTAARQVMQRLRKSGLWGWEHKGDHTLPAQQWRQLARHLKELDQRGALLIDDAHSHLQEINDLIDGLVSDKNRHLKMLLVSSRNHWNPRVKTPQIFKCGREFHLSRLNDTEIDRLLQLIDVNDAIRALVEPVFSGFSKQERRRRLVERCEADMFVCLKNIFASETFDDIILREYASLELSPRDVYRYVAAMETAGVRVHRQLVIRLLGISAQSISSLLSSLTDIIHEYTISEKEGLYGWNVRHSVIAAIITKFKFPDIDDMVRLFERVIDCISPTYEIEIRTIRELCNIESGLPRIPDKEVQNRLLRRMMSVAPGERVPRHRLIRNLIEAGAYEKAETEIRIFDKDFGSDGPVHRYKINLMVARATRTPGILQEDRIAILDEARGLAKTGIVRYPYNKSILMAYAQLGVEYHRLTSKYDVYDDAMAKLRAAEEELGDPDISRIISRFERRMTGQDFSGEELSEEN